MDWASRLYRFGIVTGLKTCMRGRVALGLKSMLNPVRSGFSRYLEIPYLIEQCRGEECQNILDMGSPKHAALFLSRQLGKSVTAVDIQDDFIEPYRFYADTLRLKNLVLEQADGTSLRYADESFDTVYAVSVLEHLPEKGDSLAVKEIHRVLKKGGKCILTLPFAPKEEDIYWEQDIYERKLDGARNFFSRLYSRDSLAGRIIEPSKLEETDRKYFTQKNWKFLRQDNPRNADLSRISPLALLFIHPLGLFLAKRLFRSCEASDIAQEIPGTVCLTLEKRGEA